MDARRVLLIAGVEMSPPKVVLPVAVRLRVIGVEIVMSSSSPSSSSGGVSTTFWAARGKTVVWALAEDGGVRLADAPPEDCESPVLLRLAEVKMLDAEVRVVVDEEVRWPDEDAR